MFNKVLVSNVYINNLPEFSKFFYEGCILRILPQNDNEWLEISNKSFYVKVLSVNVSFYKNINLNSMLYFFEKNYSISIENNSILYIDTMISTFLFEFFFDGPLDSSVYEDNVVESNSVQMLDVFYGCAFY